MTNAALTTLLWSLPDLYAAQTLDTLPRRMMAFLSRLVPSDAIAYNEVDLKKPRLVVATDPPELAASGPVQILASLIGQHPIVQHQLQTGDLSARKISDFVSKEQFHRLPIYQEVYRRIGAEDQFALALHATADTIVALAMNRSRRNFTEEDRALLNLAQPHLVRAYRNAAALTRLRQELALTRNRVDALPMGVAVLGRRMRIVFSTGRARQLLRRYFAGHSSAKTLPAELRLWLTRSRQWQGRALPNATNTFSRNGSTGKLLVQFVRDEKRDESVLLLEEKTAMPVSERLQSLGLTPREAEVLRWVARGKSNPEIAIILGAAPRTVQKHLEHIFSKLGVATRTDAARRALESFSPDLRSI